MTGATPSMDSSGALDEPARVLPQGPKWVPVLTGTTPGALLPAPEQCEPAPSTASDEADARGPILLPHPTAQAEAADEPPRTPKITRRIAPADLEAGPSVSRDRWVREPEPEVHDTYRTLLMGRQPIARPRTRPLPRPQRFSAPSPMRSAVIFAVVLIVIGISAIAAVETAHVVAPLFSTPAHATPTVQHTPTPGLPH